MALSSLHHVIDLEWIGEAYRFTRKDGAPGIDGVTAVDYAKNLEANLLDLLGRIKSGRYKAPPVRRTYHSLRRLDPVHGGTPYRHGELVVHRLMRAAMIIQRGLRTPTVQFFARFFIGIIPGLVAEFAFMVPSTRVVLSSSAARLMGCKQIGGLKSRPGCSTGRHVRTPSFWQLSRLLASTHFRRSPRFSIWR